MNVIRLAFFVWRPFNQQQLGDNFVEYSTSEDFSP
jgi:hypothetical protein